MAFASLLRVFSHVRPEPGSTDRLLLIVLGFLLVVLMLVAGEGVGLLLVCPAFPLVVSAVGRDSGSICAGQDTWVGRGWQ